MSRQRSRDEAGSALPALAALTADIGLGLIGFVLAGVGEPLHRDHVLLGAGAEDDDAGGVAADHADLAHRRADELPLVGDQQDLVAFLNREGGREPSALLGEVLRQQALAAAAGAPELIGR